PAARPSTSGYRRHAADQKGARSSKYSESRKDLSMNIILAPGLLEEIVAHARESLPHEGCGLILGSERTGTRFLPMANSLKSATAYAMDPAELIAAFRTARERGETLVAIYHSHPKGPAEPSASDIERAEYPQAAHIIVSLAATEQAVTRA